MDIGIARKAALEFLKAHTAGVVATVSREGVPHASAVYYISDDTFSLYFITLRSSRKYAAIQANPRVAFVVVDTATPRTLQVEGMAAELRDEESVNAHMPGLLAALTSNSRYYAPITKLDFAATAVVWVQAKWVRWGDYASIESGTAHVLTEIPLE